MTDFRGAFPAIVTPMTSEGRLDEAAFREVMEFDIRSGVHGFWIAGGTGESVLLDDDENMRMAEIAVDQARGRVANIMHVGAATTARSAQLAEHAAKVGVDAICCVPAFFYRMSDEAIVEHYRVVAAAADLPFFVYNLPQYTGVEVTPELMQKIQDQVPQLVGVKHSGLTFMHVRAFTKMGLSCFIGNCMLMLPALTIGAVGCIDGPLTAAPEIWVEIWDAYNAGDLARAEVAQDRGGALRTLLRQFGLHAPVKALVSERLGIDCGDPRPPGRPLTPAQKTYVLDKAAEIGLTRLAVV